MRYYLTKVFEISASHCLNLDYFSNCNKLHGHNYIIEVTVEIPDINDMVYDFSQMKKDINSLVLNKLDHSNLNDYIENPIVENLARYIWAILYNHYSKANIDLHRIKIYETRDSYVEMVRD